MIARISASIFGLPVFFDSDRIRQKKQNPVPCQATTVSGLTTIRALLRKGPIRAATVSSCAGLYLFQVTSDTGLWDMTGWTAGLPRGGLGLLPRTGLGQ
jgi:hypothetical protein